MFSNIFQFRLQDVVWNLGLRKRVRDVNFQRDEFVEEWERENGGYHKAAHGYFVEATQNSYHLTIQIMQVDG